MAAAATPSASLLYQTSNFSQKNLWQIPNQSLLSVKMEKRDLVRCSAKKKISFVDQILDYIEGGPKLRKWYGAPELLPKDGSVVEDEDDEIPDEAKDAVLVTNGDSEMGQSMTGDASNQTFLKKALRGVRAIISPNEGFLSNVGGLKGTEIEHIVLLSQLSVYRSSNGIQALVKGNAKKLAEQDESMLMASGIPYTIIRAGILENTPGGKQGFKFDEGCAVSGSLSKEDAAFICVEALEAVPKKGLIFEVANGDEKVSDWKECFSRLLERAE